MYFDEAPKRDIKDLYNYREELNQLIGSIKGGARLTVIEGPRRTGKTSLLLTALGLLERPSMVIDAREFSLSATLTRRDLIQALERSLNKFLLEEQGWRDRLSAAFKGLQGVEVEPGIPPRVSLTWGSIQRKALDLATLFETLGRAAESHETSIIIAFDEAQEFKRLAGLSLSRLMAHLYDYVKGVQLIVTGSQVGVLNDFLGVDDPREPLFGRAMTRIRLSRLRPKESEEFLRLGFSQIGLSLGEGKAEAVLDRLDGSIGWLTYVGVVSRRAGRFDDGVLAEAVRMGSELAALEFTNYLSLRSQAGTRYALIVKALSGGPVRWSEVKRAVESAEGRSVPDFNFNNLLTNLVKGGFVEKTDDGLYEVADPLLLKAARDHLF